MLVLNDMKKYKDMGGKSTSSRLRFSLVEDSPTLYAHICAYLYNVINNMCALSCRTQDLPDLWEEVGAWCPMWLCGVWGWQSSSMSLSPHPWPHPLGGAGRWAPATTQTPRQNHGRSSGERGVVCHILYIFSWPIPQCITHPTFSLVSKQARTDFDCGTIMFNLMLLVPQNTLTVLTSSHVQGH